jgi:outer membrane protein OmpA-like peptidoglycan-associated protein
MKSKNFYLLALVLVLFSSNLVAQSAKLEKAKRMMKELDYQSAVELFNSILAKGANAEASINLAECYRKIGDSKNAEFVYGQVVRLPEAQPIHSLYYGEMLQRNGKCDLAKEWYQKFVTAVPEDVRGQYLSKACDYEEELKTKNADVYDVKRANINSDVDDFGGHFYKDGIVFASERDKGVMSKRTHSWTGQPFLNLYFVPVKGCGTEVTYGRPEPFSTDINSKFHDAVVTFNKEQTQIYFTRNNFSHGKSATDDQGVMKLKIYTAKKTGKNGWANEESLPFNSDEYSCAHPTLSADGSKLYFASDMPGGFGGMDLYVSELEGGKWGPATNLGPGVNTEGHELFPFIHQSGRLYFASDGHMGLGGMDIIYVDDKGNGAWSTPENVGAPINSSDDDFCYNVNEDGTCGFFSSDRAGGAGRDDIYSFTKSSAPIKVFVFDAVTKAPIENATLVADKLKRTVKTGKDGKVSFELKFNTCSDFAATMEGYEPNHKEGCVKDATNNDVAVVEIPLSKLMKHSVEGVVFDLSTGLPLPDAVVQLIGGKDSVKTMTTDASGRYSFPLDNGICYKIRGEKDKYLAVSTEDTICTKDLAENKTYLVNLNLQPTTVVAEKPATPGQTDAPGQPAGNSGTGPVFDPKKGTYAVNGKPANDKINGVTYKDGKIVNDPKSSAFVPAPSKYIDDKPSYLLHVYYDFDQAFLRDESKPELQKLKKLMKDNPNYIVEIASHTDARGSDSYNNRLSQRRAESVVRWLVSNGIERDRLVPRGYGESMASNQCVNLIPCTEKEHQMNRRTEFRVLGCKDCVDDSKKILSAPNANAKVDKCHGCPF